MKNTVILMLRKFSEYLGRGCDVFRRKAFGGTSFLWNAGMLGEI